ncbi:MAG: cobalamin B12-binding domain-containing protein [Bacteroidetes bacterium]|nr:cobalamin B12-binding domain-containing protein [Bacteroidota bacterium]MBL6942860.1 cobalamin-dependent protein [Bacteroidales bacterium]
MKVLLISANTERINMQAMPLGLACVAEAVKNKGHDVMMVDLMVETDAEAILAEAIREFRPQCIGISVRNVDDQNYESPRFLLEKVKPVLALCRNLTNVPIVLGGAGYSVFPENALAYLNADMGIEGEGEIAFPALLSNLENNSDLSLIPGLHILNRGLQYQRILAKNLDELKLPDTSILSESASKNEEPWIPVQSRRGCALNCSYCSTPGIEGSVLRLRSPEIVSAWIDNWVYEGFTKFFFVDNTFNRPADYAKELCRQILKKRLNIRWRCIIYPKNVDKELVELMADAGCKQISLGFESGSDQMLKNLNKQFTKEDVWATSLLFADSAIERNGFLMLGGPGETKKSVEESLAFADSLELENLRLTIGIRIYPNTQLAEMALKEGVITSKSNLLYPHFYLARGLEGWLPSLLKEWQASRPNIIM